MPDGPSTRELLALARQHDITIGAGLVERGEDGALYNTYVVAMPDGRVHRHRKLHAFEHEAIRSGSEYTVFDLPQGWRAGVLICYDNNLIENVRATALLGRGRAARAAPDRRLPHEEPASDGRDRPRALGQPRAPIRRRSSANSAATRAAAG